MTMSVGLGKIQNDPKASVLTRKALGALSTPGLLVHDTGLSIDGEGRIYIKLKADGGLLQDDDGLYLEPEPIVIGIDSHVDLFSDDHDREWNARLTGSAPNFIESGLAIGTEDFSGTFTSPDVDYDIPKVAITATTAQMRIAYDRESFTQVKVFDGGRMGLFSVGSTPGFYLESGDGINTEGGLIINRGTSIEQVIVWTFTASFAGGGTLGSISWEELLFNIPSDTGYDVRPGQDVVTVMPKNSVTLPNEWLAYTGRISATNRVSIRVCWFDVVAADARQWIFLIHRMQA